jgi:hypothetical protein
VHKDQISDTDAVDPPDNMAADYVFSFTTKANVAPTDIQLSNSSIAKNQPSGTDIGTLTTSNPDAGDTSVERMQTLYELFTSKSKLAVDCSLSHT